MAYYFMAEAAKGKYRPINISESKYFQGNTRRYSKTFAYSLDEIDRFTTMFDDETELRERLVEEGVLPYSLFEKPLSIRNVIKNEYNKVPYDFLYQKDIEYIMDPVRLIEKIIRRFYEGDLLLIKKIANRFIEDYRCQSTAPEVKQLIEISIREGKINHHFEDLDENYDRLLPRLIKLIILESYDNGYGNVKYKNKIRYRNLHTLIALINYHDKENAKLEEKTTTVKDYPEQTKVSAENKRFVRERSLGKKKYVLDEQIGFDI